MKHVRIVVVGSIDEPIVFLLRRGVTAGVIVKQLQLEDHILFTLPTSEQPAYSLLPSDDVYCEARSGDPLLLFLPQRQKSSPRGRRSTRPFFRKS